MNEILNIDHPRLVKDVYQSLQDDLGSGDITSDLVSVDATMMARLITREPGIVCGIPWFNEVFNQIKKNNFELKKMFAKFKHLFNYKAFNLLTLTLCATSSAPYVFYTLSPFFFIKDLHVSAVTYGLFIALLQLAQAAGSYLVSALSRRIKDRSIIIIGTTSFVLCVFFFTVLMHVTMNPFALIIPIIICFLMLPLSNQVSRMNASLVMPTMIGAAISLCSVLYNMSCTLTAISAAHIDGNEIGYGMFILALIGLVSSLFIPPLLSDDVKKS